MYFDFNEMNILLQNAQGPSKEALLQTLFIIEGNTRDPLLQSSLGSLQAKLQCLSEDEFHRLYSRLQGQTIMTTQPFHCPL